jgi:hypothetical protein
LPEWYQFRRINGRYNALFEENNSGSTDAVPPGLFNLSGKTNIYDRIDLPETYPARKRFPQG